MASGSTKKPMCLINATANSHNRSDPEKTCVNVTLVSGARGWVAPGKASSVTGPSTWGGCAADQWTCRRNRSEVCTPAFPAAELDGRRGAWHRAPHDAHGTAASQRRRRRPQTRCQFRDPDVSRPEDDGSRQRRRAWMTEMPHAKNSGHSAVSLTCSSPSHACAGSRVILPSINPKKIISLALLTARRALCTASAPFYSIFILIIFIYHICYCEYNANQQSENEKCLLGCR